MAGLTAGDISLRYSIILGGIGRGLSGNKIIQELTAAGLGARRSTLLGLISDARATYAAQERTAGLDFENPVPPDAITRWPSRTSTGYGHVVKLPIRNVGTGVIGERYHTVLSPHPMTPAEAIQEAMNANGDAAERYEYTIMGGILVNVVEYVPTVV